MTMHFNFYLRLTGSLITVMQNNYYNNNKNMFLQVSYLLRYSQPPL